MTALTVAELKKWYAKKLADKSKEFVKKADRSYKVVDRALKDIQLTARDLKEASEGDDSESVGISTRFALKVDEIVRDFDMRKEISYDNTEVMQDEIQHFIQELWGAGARWIGRMDKKHKSTIKQLDGYMRDLAQEMKNIGKLLYEFSWLKDLERIAGRIGALEELAFSREVYEDKIRQIRQKLDQAKVEHDLASAELTRFKETSNVSEILNLDDEAERVQSVLRMKLNTLKKPVKKFLQHDTGVRISPEGQKALAEYFEDPLKAIVREPDGYPALIEGLDAMREAIENGSLSLKDRRLERRAIEEIDAIKQGALKEFQEKGKAIDQKRSAYAGSEVYAMSAKLQAKFDEARKNLEYHTNDLLRTGDEIKRQLEKVAEFKSRIETDLQQSFGESVTIEVGVTLEPLLEKCTV